MKQSIPQEESVSFPFLDAIQTDSSWSFLDKKRHDTTYITHCYHRYPAKFIPQIASRLIAIHTQVGDKVADVFAGCGTTLVEAKVSGRHSVGVDINPVAALITQAKVTAIQPKILQEAFWQLEAMRGEFNASTLSPKASHQRIQYWFKQSELHKLHFILNQIEKIPEESLRTFFLCGFSHILKNCSIWMQKSNKPTRDLKKKPADPFKAFHLHIKKMLQGAAAFYDLLQQRNFINTRADIYCADAKKCVQIPSNSIDLIVTSPPYVTSYQYADLHQLSALWLRYTKDIKAFRNNFVGSINASVPLKVNLEAENIVAALAEKSKTLAGNVNSYFADMRSVFGEMHRILKPGKKMCVVIGDTKLKGVEIANTRVFLSYLKELNMSVVSMIKREIPNKNIPSTRDKYTGRFTKVDNKSKVLSYATEYILTAEKI